MGLKINLAVSGGWSHVINQLTAQERFGKTPAPIGTMSLADGTGSQQANQLFAADISIPTVTMQLYDLKGGNGEVDVMNRTLAMTKLVGVYLEITEPASTKTLRFGPQAQTNAAQLWFFAATANYYDVMQSKLLMVDEYTGWTLDATHKVIAIYNPSLVTVAGKLRVFGRM